jgi:two-component system chemotaxis response regulator CheB
MLRVMVVDDSAVARHLLVQILDDDPELRVVAEAADGAQAVLLAESVRPDVITMDINMPTMDGLEATRTIMERVPRPIVLISSLYEPEEVRDSFPGLEAGALTVLGKPGSPSSPGFARQAAEIVRTVKDLARVKVVTRRRRKGTARGPVAPPSAPRRFRPAGRHPIGILAMGASTGGPAALAKVFSGLSSDLPVPIVVVQHMAAGFDTAFADWLGRVSPLEVGLASHLGRLAAGKVLVAPHGHHLGVTREGRTVLSSEAPIGGHQPSATFLFRSVANAYGKHALGVILTGMGDDGAPGLVDLKEAGGLVIAQDEASSVVYGMPRAAIELGAVDWVADVDDIASSIVETVNRGAMEMRSG